MNGIQITTFERCSVIFEFVRREYISLKKPTHFGILFSIPGISVATERVFSITNSLWAVERNYFLVETIKVVIVTSTDFEELSRNDFYTLISETFKLLQEIRSSTKYKTSAQEERTTPSTLTGNQLQIKFCMY
jgi:hypothetical protein